MRVLPIFVYGTLQRGEQRERCWPHQPQKVEWATISAALYDLGPHPAIVPGEKSVFGELWHIAADGLVETLAVLDRIEGFQQPNQPNWYRREVVPCWPHSSSSADAYAYFYDRPAELADSQKLESNEHGLCYWRRLRSSVDWRQYRRLVD